MKLAKWMKNATALLLGLSLPLMAGSRSGDRADTDKKLLKVQVYQDYCGLFSETSYAYNDDGLPVRSICRTFGDTLSEQVYTYTYDEEGRLLNKHMTRGDGGYETDVFVRSYNDDGTLASSSYSGLQDMWTTEEYTYDDSGLAVREKTTIAVGDVDISGTYSFENSVDEQGNLTATRHEEEDSEHEDAVFIYGPDGRMLQGYDEYWLTPITYEYVPDPCFCVRAETGTTGDGYGGMATSTQQVAYILDSAGKEVESFTLGTVGDMELTYDGDGYISSAKRYFDGWELGETRFIYGDPAENGGDQAGSVTLTVTGDQVNIRTGPGTDYEAIGQVSHGFTLVVTGKSDNWYQVEYNGGTGYIIQDYVLLNSAPETDSASESVTVDEAVLAATQEGDWSGFIGALAERYGVMSTAEMTMSDDGAESTAWTGSDVTGLLSATVLDLDADGQQELFTVRMDNYGEDLSGYGNLTDTTHLYLGVYEPGSGEPAAERMLYLLSDVVGSLGANSQFTVFTYDYNGVRYICLDNYATMNETETLVDFFTYDGSQLVFTGAAQYQEHGQGDVYVYRADAEPASFRDFVEHPLLNRCDVWQSVMAFSIEEANWQSLGPGEEQPYFNAYADILAEYGLAADGDERIWVNQTDERQTYFGLTAPDVYAAAEGALRPLAQVERHYQYDSEWNSELFFHRTDFEGTLDSFR